MIAAIYARKSTDDSDRHAEARSTRRQVESATRYAELRGWTVDPRYIFVDENTSGAEWKHRPGFHALLAALEPRPPGGGPPARGRGRRDSFLPERRRDQPGRRVQRDSHDLQLAGRQLRAAPR